MCGGGIYHAVALAKAGPPLYINPSIHSRHGRQWAVEKRFLTSRYLKRPKVPTPPATNDNSSRTCRLAPPPPGPENRHHLVALGGSLPATSVISLAGRNCPRIGQLPAHLSIIPSFHHSTTPVPAQPHTFLTLSSHFEIHNPQCLQGSSHPHTLQRGDLPCRLVALGEGGLPLRSVPSQPLSSRSARQEAKRDQSSPGETVPGLDNSQPISPLLHHSTTPVPAHPHTFRTLSAHFEIHNPQCLQGSSHPHTL